MNSLRQFLQNPFVTGFFAIGFISFFTSAVLTLTALIGRPNWAFNLAGHFQMQYLFIQIAAYLMLQATGHRWLRLFALALASMNIVQIWPMLCLNPNTLIQSPPDQSRIGLLQMNVWRKNESYNRACDFIRQSKPDLILPSTPTGDTAEILLFSKFPVQSAEVPLFKASNRQYVVAKLDIGGHSVNVMVVHLTSPLDNDSFIRQDTEYTELTELRKKYADNFLIVGDFNATSWTRGFRRFIAASQLVDSRLGRGIQPTWPAHNPLIAIPIDHCLVSRNFRVLNRFTGPNVGSDHLTVCIDLDLNN